MPPSSTRRSGGGGGAGYVDMRPNPETWIATAGTNGTANTGGGGGGGGYNYNQNGTFVGGQGGSGIVIVRYTV